MGRGESGNQSGRGKSPGKKNRGLRPAKVISLEQYRWRKAGQVLRQKLGEFAADPLFTDEVARAQQMYLAGIDPDLVNENGEIIMERCFEWFIFDYVMEGGETLVDIYSAVADVSAMERTLIREWLESRMSVFEVSSVSPGKGLKLRDLILNRKLTVNNYMVSGKLEKGSIIFMRVLPVGNEYEFSTGGLALPSVCGRPLIKKIKSDMNRYAARRSKDSFSPDRYLRDRAYKINAWVLDFALNPPDFENQGGRRGKPAMSSRIAQRITDLFLDDYYDKWINQPVVALDGKTPRESCKTAHGRAKVEDLLKELEKVEARRLKKGEPHYDINKVRARLGLIPGEQGNKSGTEKKQPPAPNPNGQSYRWSSNAQAGVALLIKEYFETKDYSPEQAEGALKLWSDYCSKVNPVIRKEKLWLVVVVYTLARLELNGSIQQHKLAEEFGVSASSLSEKYRSMCGSLDLVVFDRRYTSGKFPLGELELSDPLLASIFFRLKL